MGFDPGRKQQPVVVQPLEHPDRVRDRLPHHPRVVAKRPSGQLVPVLVHRAFEVPARHQPQIICFVAGDAAALKVEHLPGTGATEVGHDDEAGRQKQP
jgi:hypothetical protein